MGASDKNVGLEKQSKAAKRLSSYLPTVGIYLIIFLGLVLIGTAFMSFYHFLQAAPHI
ncbi:hypothetical protein [Methylophaga sp. OBS3]|uniref:hypothetical protein n=1 Tax=Methylophaga sp. OBS3 TaxID=2991934 RepID=UPI002256DDFD|nr:hypothetical protein [Methylophaga sp. OBS3]MCX4190288.1 hypothetical protein [Methylophaga sp. OBS3]